MSWELEKAIFEPKKDKCLIWCSKTPKPPEMPIKQGKASQHHNWPRCRDWPQMGPKIAIKLRKKTPKKDKWFHFHAATGAFLKKERIPTVLGAAKFWPWSHKRFYSRPTKTPLRIAKDSTADPLRRPLRCPLRRPLRCRLRRPLRRPLPSPPLSGAPSRRI